MIHIEVTKCHDPLKHLENVRRLFDVNDYDENTYPAVIAYIKDALGEPLREAEEEDLAKAKLFLETGEWET